MHHDILNFCVGAPTNNLVTQSGRVVVWCDCFYPELFRWFHCTRNHSNHSGYKRSHYTTKALKGHFRWNFSRNKFHRKESVDLDVAQGFSKVPEKFQPKFQRKWPFRAFVLYYLSVMKLVTGKLLTDDWRSGHYPSRQLTVHWQPINAKLP